jgi:hypothetical protein
MFVGHKVTCIGQSSEKPGSRSPQKHGGWSNRGRPGTDPGPTRYLPVLCQCVGSPALPRGRGTTGTGPRLQDRVETLTLPLGPYPRRLPLPFSRGRVQRELDKSNWITSLTLTIYSPIPRKGSRCPKGGYTGNWHTRLQAGSKPTLALGPYQPRLPLPLPEGEGNGNWTRATWITSLITLYPQPYLRRLPLPSSRGRDDENWNVGYLDRVE